MAELVIKTCLAAKHRYSSASFLLNSLLGPIPSSRKKQNHHPKKKAANDESSKFTEEQEERDHYYAKDRDEDNSEETPLESSLKELDGDRGNPIENADEQTPSPNVVLLSDLAFALENFSKSSNQSLFFFNDKVGKTKKNRKRLLHFPLDLKTFPLSKIQKRGLYAARLANLISSMSGSKSLSKMSKSFIQKVLKSAPTLKSNSTAGYTFSHGNNNKGLLSQKVPISKKDINMSGHASANGKGLALPACTKLTKLIKAPRKLYGGNSRKKKVLSTRNSNAASGSSPLSSQVTTIDDALDEIH